jgi:membrane-associated protease RseP (regulator of RpoE activity)
VQTRSRTIHLNTVSSLIESGIAVAGVIAFHELGHFAAARVQNMKVESFNVGYGPKLLSFEDNQDISYNLRAVPLGGYVAFPSNAEEVDEETGEILSEKDDPDLLQNRPPLQRALVISAGVMANLLLTFLLSAGTAWSTGIARPIFSDGIEVTQTPSPTSPAVMAGILKNDVILSADGQTFKGGESTVSEFVSLVRSNANNKIALEILRDDKKVKLFVTPQATGPKSQGTIGIGVNALVKGSNVEKATNFLEAAQIGMKETQKIILNTWGALSKSFQSGLIGNDVGGPISVVKAGASMADTSPTALVGFAAALSINLAILNALPVPALDGGQFAFVLVELLAGKPVPRKIKDSVTALAFSVLLIFGSYTIFGDIAKATEPMLTLNANVPTLSDK